MKGGLYDENAEPGATHSPEKTPNKNPRPHFEPKGEVEFFLLLHTGVKPGSFMENCTVSTSSEMSLALNVAECSNFKALSLLDQNLYPC